MPETEQVILPEHLESPAIQIAAARVLSNVFNWEVFQERGRHTNAQTKLAEGIHHTRRLMRGLYEQDKSLHAQSDKLNLLTWHPNVLSYMIDSTFWDVYMQAQNGAFELLE